MKNLIRQILPPFVYRALRKILSGYGNSDLNLPHYERVRKWGHRAYVGGSDSEAWYGIGKRQYHFLVSHGLQAEHQFLDVACGSLRLGQYLIPMLSAGNYSGIEGEKALVTAGIEKEMLFDLVEKKNPTFIYNYDFNFEGCSGYDYAIAQSLFTHLTLEDIRKCFVNLYPISNDGGKFYFTFFEGDESKNIHTASHANKNWQYNFASLKNIAEECGFRVEYIGDWGHEKEQMMAVAIKKISYFLAYLQRHTMSKRCDSQENYSGDLRKLLQQRINANRVKRETLSDEELHRLSKLEVILIALEEGEHVQNRQLKRWLTEDELARLEVLWEEQKSYREELKDKPSELKQYEEKLKKATFYANKAEGLRRKGNKQAVAANRSQCESLCEDALEILQEIVDADASLQIWFDRALDFSFGSHIDAQLGNLPHVVTSRSIDKQSGDSRIMSKQQVKIVVVEQASDALKYEYKSAAKADDVATDSSKLADFLKTL